MLCYLYCLYCLHIYVFIILRCMQRIKQLCRASRCTFHSHFAAKSLAIWLASSATAAATAFVQVIALAHNSINNRFPAC